VAATDGGREADDVRDSRDGEEGEIVAVDAPAGRQPERYERRDAEGVEVVCPPPREARLHVGARDSPRVEPRYGWARGQPSAVPREERPAHAEPGPGPLPTVPEHERQGDRLADGHAAWGGDLERHPLEPEEPAGRQRRQQQRHEDAEEGVGVAARDVERRERDDDRHQGHEAPLVGEGIVNAVHGSEEAHAEGAPHDVARGLAVRQEDVVEARPIDRRAPPHR